MGVLLGFGWMLVVGVYFVLFWSTAGQTPGMRLLHLRVQGPGGETPWIAGSFLRLVGLVVAIVPFFAGFVPVLFTDRRRGLPDLLAGTVVVTTRSEPELAFGIGSVRSTNMKPALLFSEAGCARVIATVLAAVARGH